MNDILVVRDGSTIDELGKESGNLHRFLCAFRNAGGTVEDLRAMSDPCHVDDLSWILGRLHNVDPDDPCAIYMNLDAAPDLPKGSDESAQKIVDKRMGFWSVKFNDPRGLRIGNYVIRIMPVISGHCVDKAGKWFNRAYLDVKKRRGCSYLDLNAQAATALCRKWDVAQGLFVELQGSIPDWLDQTVFFLGTVWKQQKPGGGEGVFAKTLHCDNDGIISIADKLLPIGEWPKDCFVAVLETLSSHK